MKYINKFSTNADYQAFTEGGGYVTPNICYVMESKELKFKPKIIENNTLQFPVYFNLTKISSEEYKMEPTPESIAFADYFIQNAVFNGIHYDLVLDKNMVYINGIEQQIISVNAYGVNNYNCYDCMWNGTSSGFWCNQFWIIDGEYPKGTFRSYNDD